jgi:Uma2 family endonuclease
MGEAAIRQDRMTFEEAALLDPDETPGELDEGRFVPMPNNTWRHGEIAGNVYYLLRAYARQHPGWSVAVGDPGTKLRRNPDTLRGPDVAIVRAERKPEGRGAEGWLDGAPDVAVEVLGDTQKLSELFTKALEYIAAGGKMVWVLEPETARVLVFTPPNQIRLLRSEETLDGGDVLPGFSCRVGEMFE